MPAERTEKQRRFIAHYATPGDPGYLNATKAAEAAGYSVKTAYAQGHRLLKNAEIQAEIAKAAERHAERLDITAERVLRELSRLAFFDPRKLYGEDGRLLPVAELDDDTAAALSSIEVLEEFAGRGEDRSPVGFTKKLRLWDKKGSLELLGKHLALFTDKIEHSITGGVLVVPAPIDTEDWARAAEGQQRAITKRRRG